MFMLNMLFAFTRSDLPSDRNGLFVEAPDNPDIDPLRNSKHWLKFQVPNPNNNFDPEAPPNPGWEDLGAAGTLMIPSNAGPRHLMAIRIAPDPATPIADDATATVVIAFGRPVIARQGFASPFLANNQTIAMIHRQLPPRQPGVNGWTINLGQIGRVPQRQNLTHRYEFALGVEITSNGDVQSFGEDPEFDIGL